MLNIKIIISTLFLTVLSIQNIKGQDERTKLDFGVKAGINVSNVWDSKGEDFKADAKVGFAAGVFVGIPIGTFIGFQPELLVSQKGFQGSGTLLSVPYSFERTTTYVEVPLLLQLKPAEFITFVVGPQFSYLLNQKDKRTLGINSTEQNQEFENENIRKNILGFLVGADLFYESIVFSARAGYDFQTNHGDGTSSTPRYKNQWLQFTLGYKF